MMLNHNFPYSSSVCLVVSFAFLLCGCAGVTFNATAPAPSPTPQAGPADRVLLQMGPAGTLYQEFAATDSGLNQVANDITLPTRFLAIAPPIASVHGFLFALDSAEEVPSSGDRVQAIDISQFSPRDGGAQVSFSVFAKAGKEAGSEGSVWRFDPGRRRDEAAQSDMGVSTNRRAD